MNSIVTIIGVSSLIVYFISIIGIGKMFEKAGEPIWKGWLPGSNIYTLYKLTWNKNIFWINMILTILISSFPTVSDADIGWRAAKGILLIISLAIDIVSAKKISRSYGHGTGYTIGLIFIPVIFYLILGFGKSEYKGANV